MKGSHNFNKKIIKILILTHSYHNVSTIYPVPDEHNTILLPSTKPPTNEEFWINDECRTILEQRICQKEHHVAEYRLQNISKCYRPSIINIFKIYKQLSSNELVSTNTEIEIIQNIGNNLIDSACKIIIENKIFNSASSNFAVDILEIIPKKYRAK